MCQEYRGSREWGNGRIILGGAMFDRGAFCTGLLGLVRAYSRVGPTAI